MAKKNLNVIVGAIDKLSKPFRAINNVIEKVVAPVNKVNRALNGLGRQAGIKKFNRSLKQSSRHARNAAKGIGKIAAMAGLLTGLAGGPLALFSKAYADAGDNIAKSSQRLGIGIGALQEFRFVANRASITTETFDMALQRFGRRSAEAANGTGEAKGALKALGVELKDSHGNLRETESLLLDALGALDRVKDPLTRNALAMKLFDSEGVKLVQMAKGGKKAISALRKESRDLGSVMSGEAAKAAEEFHDKSLNLGSVLTGLRNRIGAHLLPVLTPMIERFTGLGKDSGPAVSKWAEKFADKLPDRLEKLWNGLKRVGSVLSSIGKFASWVDDNFGLVNTVMTIFAGVIAFQVVSAVASLALAFKGLGVAIGLTPIGLIITGVVAVVAGILWLSRNWDKVQAGISKGVAAAGDVFKKMGKGILSVFKFILKNNPFSVVAKTINGAIKALTGFDVLDKLSEKLRNLLPERVIKFFGLDKVSAPVSASIPNARSEVGGLVRVQIDSEGRARVTQVESQNNNVPVEADVGMVMRSSFLG